MENSDSNPQGNTMENLFKGKDTETVLVLKERWEDDETKDVDERNGEAGNNTDDDDDDDDTKDDDTKDESTKTITTGK